MGAKAILQRYANQARARQANRPGSRNIDGDNRAQSLSVIFQSEPGDWSDSRLRVWCHRMPHLLLAVSPDLTEIDWTGYPREKGPPCEEDVSDVAHWTVAMQLADQPHCMARLARWALGVLYPSYEGRTGDVHPCRDRVQWLLDRAEGRQPAPDLKPTLTVVLDESETSVTEPATAEPTLPTPNKREIIRREDLPADTVVVFKGKKYLTHEGLLRLTHQYGVESMKCEIFMWDPKTRSAAVICTIKGVRGTYTEIGDADPSNVSNGIAGACLRMAATRAENRAMRLYLGLGMTTREELPGQRAAPKSLEEMGLTQQMVNAYLAANNKRMLDQITAHERDRLYEWLEHKGGADRVIAHAQGGQAA
ncbi:MAG: hypothetical protein AAFV53_26160 [Myxococcota bacterium]